MEPASSNAVRRPIAIVIHLSVSLDTLLLGVNDYRESKARRLGLHSFLEH